MPSFPCHAVPMPCRSAKSLDCVFRIGFIQCSCVWFTHTMPGRPCRSHAMSLPCRSESNFSRPGHSATWERHDMFELASAVQRRHVGDLPAFGFFRLLRGLSRRTRHCRRMAGARHGMCELTRQGNGMGTAWYVWISLKRDCYVITIEFLEWKHDIWLLLSNPLAHALYEKLSLCSPTLNNG
jgi:hypothetical protein